MRLVFLDFDGAILPFDPSGSGDRGIPSKEAVDNLNSLLQMSGANVVVSSSWRVGRSLSELNALLRTWGVRANVVGRTGTDPDDDRCVEILNWIDDHVLDESKMSFVVVDHDLVDLEPIANRVVSPDPKVGISWEDVQCALKLLQETQR